MSKKKRYTSERNLNSRLSQSKTHNKRIFDRLNQGFGGIANTIKKFGIVAARVIGGGTFSAKQFIDLASGLQTAVSADGVTGVNRGGQQRFWSTVQSGTW